MIVMVRRESENIFEYFIGQGKRKVSFFIDRQTHEDLKRAQYLAEIETQTPALPSGVTEFELLSPGGKPESLPAFHNDPELVRQ